MQDLGILALPLTNSGDLDKLPNFSLIYEMASHGDTFSQGKV